MSAPTTSRTTKTTTTTTAEGSWWERRRKPGAFWPFAAAGLVGLGLLYNIPVRHQVEDDLTKRSSAVLAAAGATGVNVQFTGRDGVLSGTVPPGTDVDALVAKVKAVEGVRVVTATFPGSGEATATPTPTPAASDTMAPSMAPSTAPSQTPSTDSLTTPSVTAASAGGKVTLSGTVPSQAAADALVAAATTAYGAGNVVNQLTVDAGVSDLGLGAAAQAIGALGKDSEATLSYSGGAVRLEGTVASEAAKKAVLEAAAGVTGDPTQVIDKLTVKGGGASQQAFDSLPAISFETASSTLTPAGRKAVEQAAAILQANPTIKVRIEGYTDDLGDAEVNRQLSVGRAITVRQTLWSLGVDSQRMSYRGFGEANPRVPNTSEANRALNRRVVFVVL